MKKILAMTTLALINSISFAQDIPPMPIFAQKDTAPSVEKKALNPVTQNANKPTSKKTVKTPKEVVKSPKEVNTKK